MKLLSIKWLLPLLALSLTACVQYHYPAPDVLVVSEPRSNYTVVRGGSWGRIYGAYPWWAPNSHGYRYGGWRPWYGSIGYSVYRDPYLDFYYPWYGWTPRYAWAYPYRSWSRYPYPVRGPWHGPGSRYPQHPGWQTAQPEPPPQEADRQFDGRPVERVTLPTRNVLPPSSSSAMDRGMVVRSRGVGKPGPSRTTPVNPRTKTPGVSVRPGAVPRTVTTTPSRADVPRLAPRVISEPRQGSPRRVTQPRVKVPRTTTTGAARSLRPANPRITTPRARVKSAPKRAVRTRPAPRPVTRPSSSEEQ